MPEEQKSIYKTISAQINQEHLAMFEKLCELEMRSQSDMIRFLIVKEFERRANNQMSMFDQVSAQ